MKDLISSVTLLLCILAFSSCQKVVIDDFDEPAAKPNVTFNIRHFEQIPFDNTRATEIKDLCSMANLMIYFGNERIKSVSQKSSDSGFGTFSLNLDEGTYLAVLLAHNQSKSPKAADPEKIQFDNDLSDVFLWSKDITVTTDSSQTIDVDMHRQVAMVRFATTDSVPDSLASVKFYYTGGSAALDARTGNGTVDSKQTAIRTITEDMKGKPATFELYTIPKDNGSLKIQVTGLNSEGKTIFERTFNDVAVARNTISVFKGKLFIGMKEAAKEGDVSFTLTTSDEWSTVETTF